MANPNTARITTLSSWSQFFSAQGQFRQPSNDGAAVEHLDIDLRFIDHESHDGLTLNDVYLPNVCKLTLRGGEYVQECDDRMDCLAEVLNAISPVEVQWLNAYDTPDEQQTLSTVMVHPAITVAGEIWRSRGTLRKLVIQGGFPVPNLSAPTPFVLTPATSPCPSPGPTFGSFPGFATGLPNLSLTKPKAKKVDDNKVARDERKRLADYNLKPRFEWAFGSWGVEHVAWSFDGRYSAAAVKTILTRLFEALNTTYPSATHKAFVDPPALLALTHVSELDLDIPEQIKAYVADATFIDDTRAFDMPVEGADKERLARRFKAEMLLLQSIPNKGNGADDSAIDSADETEEEMDAMTPPMGSSFHLEGAAIKKAMDRKSSMASQQEEAMGV